MAKPKRIEMGNDSSGIVVEYVKSRDVLYIWGYYDHFVGIKGTEIKLQDFCEKLGINPRP